MSNGTRYTFEIGNDGRPKPVPPTDRDWLTPEEVNAWYLSEISSKQTQLLNALGSIADRLEQLNHRLDKLEKRQPED
jgi:hypothetical protein